MSTRSTATIALVFLAALPAMAQPVIVSVLPEAASPGDRIVIAGSNLGGVTQVRFTAVVGGFVGITNVDVAPLAVSATEVTVVVPLVNSFTPPQATPPGDPLGTVRARTANGTLSATLPFWYMEATFGQIRSAGAPTTQSSGRQAATSFVIAQGPPVPGNGAFTLTLDLGPSSFPVLLAVGSEATPPLLPVGDGLVAIDTGLPFAILQGLATDGSGRSLLPVPLPAAPLGVSLVAQWAFIDPGSGLPAVARALVAAL